MSTRPLTRQRRRAQARAANRLSTLRRRLPRVVQKLALTLLGMERYESIMFKRRHGFAVDLDNPSTYSEKLSWRKVRQVIPCAVPISNKLTVRDFVSARLGDRYLNNLLAVYKSPNDINLDALPNSFAAKGAHASGYTVLVPDKTTADPAFVQRRLRRFLKVADYGLLKNEHWYSEMAPSVIVEDLMTERHHDGPPPDYKFFCFDGKARLLTITPDRFAPVRTHAVFVDMDWQQLDISYARYPTNDIALPGRPHRFDEMVEVAQTLAQGFDFVRVDLYCPDDERVVFGEMTLTPFAGWMPFAPTSADALLGSYWTPQPRLDIDSAPHNAAGSPIAP